jgi:hypothetical protein
MQYVLCQEPPPIPPNVPPLAPATDAQMKLQTTRQHFEQSHLGSQVSCKTCHQTFDGIGYAFEEFDAMGKYRTTENTQNVDDSGFVPSTLDPDFGASGLTISGTGPGGVLNGGADLSTKLAGSPQVQSCFVTQSYRYAMGTAETPAASDTLKAMQTNFTEDTNMTDTLLTLVQLPAFVLRTTTKVGP